MSLFQQRTELDAQLKSAVCTNGSFQPSEHCIHLSYMVLDLKMDIYLNETISGPL